MSSIKKIILFSFILNVLVGYSQQKEFNFIVSVDNSLRNVYADKFIIKDKDDKSEIIRVNYVQGKISINEEDYEKLASENVARIDLTVRHVEQCGEKTETLNYEIEDFKLPWLNKGSYFVLYIYNTKKNKYKKIYDSLPAKEFTFEYDWSEGSMRRAQKKLTKEQKKCNK